MGDLYTIQTLPQASADFIREFDTRYLAALAARQADMWPERLGLVAPTNTLQTTFPISSLGLKYQKTVGDNRFKTAAEDSFDIKIQEFDEGYSAPLVQLRTQTFAYAQWQQAAQLLLRAEGRFLCSEVAARLEAGTGTTYGTCWDGSNFFATDHPVNKHDSGLGTYSNYQTNAKDVVDIGNIEAEVTLMKQNAKDDTGLVLGVEPNAILVPTAKVVSLRNLLNKDMVAGSGTESESNPLKGKFTVYEIPQLSDANDWYLVDTAWLAELPPWVVLKYAADGALGMRYYDESSDFCKDTGRIKASSHIFYGFGYGFAQSIRRVTGA